MKRFIFLIVVLTLAACCILPGATEPAVNTDAIAGYWSGEVTGELDSGEEIPTINIGILIIEGCTIGKVCGKLSEDDECPGDIILMDVDGGRYSFLSETASGTRHICGEGNIRMIDLQLRSDETIHFTYQNGVTLTGVLHRQ